MQWQVYMVECRDGSLYTGIARDLEQRLAAHNAGTGARYTRSRRPVRLVYAETRDSRSDAQRREAEIKRLRAADKRRLAGTAVART
ncbi:MAG: GIY-YIG nuclease family protein [Gammaproteobacteria bacterium]|nr:MAG: GIY-YIG nuclease family protein [Gammaproteobacteria bacterium]